MNGFIFMCILLMVIAVAGFLFFTPEGRETLKSYRPYAALAVFLLLIF